MKARNVVFTVVCGLLAGPAVLAENLFPNDYEASRAAFRQLAQSAAAVHPGAEVAAISVESRIDADLTTDYIYIPAREKFEKIMVLVSGVHGVEAPAGVMAQQLFLQEILPGVKTDRMGVLVIHALNPFGFKYHRRVNENNVDLARNFAIDDALFAQENPGYNNLNEYLNPQREVDLISVRTAVDPFYLGYLLARHSVATLRQAVVLGQYAHEGGIYYGGSQVEAQNLQIIELLKRTVGLYDASFMIDMHTGYGDAGKLHLWANASNTAAAAAAQNTLFQDMNVEATEQDSDFYMTTGDFCAYFAKTYASRLGLSMTFEYGTIGNQTTLGSIDTLYRMRMENQGYHHGFDTAWEKRVVDNRFHELFNPSDAQWREKAVAQMRAVLPVVVERFGAMNLDQLTGYVKPSAVKAPL